MDVLQAVEEVHNGCGLANPIRTAIVAQALDHWANSAPKAWGAPDRVLFMGLPTVQRVISRRENERDAGVRGKFSELASKETEHVIRPRWRGLLRGHQRFCLVPASRHSEVHEALMIRPRGVPDAGMATR
jgi:hypothetical protein